MRTTRCRLIIACFFSCAFFLGALAGCATNSLDRVTRRATRDYRFSIARWEVHQLFQNLASPARRVEQDELRDSGDVVRAYFRLLDRINALEQRQRRASASEDCPDCLAVRLRLLRGQVDTLKPQVQAALSRQVREVLLSEEIHTPLDRWVTLPGLFPPIAFVLDRPPHLLVISPRDHIESIREVMLVQDLSVDEMEEIEEQIEAAGFSALVVELGGIAATYPTFVTEDASLVFTVETVTEEWFHQYLAFTPLGFRYVLDVTGLKRNYEVATLNESLATILH